MTTNYRKMIGKWLLQVILAAWRVRTMVDWEGVVECSVRSWSRHRLQQIGEAEECGKFCWERTCKLDNAFVPRVATHNGMAIRSTWGRDWRTTWGRDWSSRKLMQMWHSKACEGSKFGFSSEVEARLHPCLSPAEALLMGVVLISAVFFLDQQYYRGTLCTHAYSLGAQIAWLAIVPWLFQHKEHT